MNHGYESAKARNLPSNPIGSSYRSLHHWVALICLLIEKKISLVSKANNRLVQAISYCPEAIGLYPKLERLYHMFH